MDTHRPAGLHVALRQHTCRVLKGGIISLLRKSTLRDSRAFLLLNLVDCATMPPAHYRSRFQPRSDLATAEFFISNCDANRLFTLYFSDEIHGGGMTCTFGKRDQFAVAPCLKYISTWACAAVAASANPPAHLKYEHETGSKAWCPWGRC